MQKGGGLKPIPVEKLIEQSRNSVRNILQDPQTREQLTLNRDKIQSLIRSSQNYSLEEHFSLITGGAHAVKWVMHGSKKRKEPDWAIRHKFIQEINRILGLYADSYNMEETSPRTKEALIKVIELQTDEKFKRSGGEDSEEEAGVPASETSCPDNDRA